MSFRASLCWLFRDMLIDVAAMLIALSACSCSESADRQQYSEAAQAVAANSELDRAIRVEPSHDMLVSEAEQLFATLPPNEHASAALLEHLNDQRIRVGGSFGTSSVECRATLCRANLSVPDQAAAYRLSSIRPLPGSEYIFLGRQVDNGTIDVIVFCTTPGVTFKQLKQKT